MSQITCCWVKDLHEKGQQWNEKDMVQDTDASTYASAWVADMCIQLYPNRVGYGIKTGPHNLLLYPEGERELESMDVFTY